METRSGDDSDFGYGMVWLQVVGFLQVRLPKAGPRRHRRPGLQAARHARPEVRCEVFGTGTARQAGSTSSSRQPATDHERGRAVAGCDSAASAAKPSQPEPSYERLRSVAGYPATHVRYPAAHRRAAFGNASALQDHRGARELQRGVEGEAEVAT